jgi:hypothetical protein
MAIGIFSYAQCSVKSTKIELVGEWSWLGSMVRNSNTPNFDKLISEGASTMHAVQLFAYSSSTNWASI